MCNQASLQELVAALKCNFLSTVTSGSSVLPPSFHSFLCFRDEWSDGSSNYNKYLFSFFLKLFTRFCSLLCLLCSALELRKLSVRFFISSPPKRREIYSQRKLQSFVVENFLHRFTIFHFLPWSKHYVIYWARGDVTGARGARGGQSLCTIYEHVIDGPAVSQLVWVGDWRSKWVDCSERDYLKRLFEGNDMWMRRDARRKEEENR